MFYRTIKKSSSKWLPTGLLLLALLLPATSWASTYGSGSYGACTYGQGCGTPTKSSPKASTPAATPAAPVNLLLNDFPEYFSASGKTLTTSGGQVIDFDVTVDGVVQHHTITIQEIGSDFAIVVISASEPITARFNIGQTQGFDVTGDGQNDIEITLGSITDGQASFTFKALSPKPATPAAATPDAGGSYLLLIIIFGGLLLLGLAIFLFLFWKRRRKKDQQPTTNLPT